MNALLSTGTSAKRNETNRIRQSQSRLGFFIGEVVFVLLYFAVRSTCPGWRMSLKKFLWTGFEATNRFR